MHAYGLGVSQAILDREIWFDNIFSWSAGTVCAYSLLNKIKPREIMDEYFLSALEEFYAIPTVKKIINIRSLYQDLRGRFNKYALSKTPQFANYYSSVGSRALLQVTHIYKIREVRTGFRTPQEFLSACDASSAIWMIDQSCFPRFDGGHTDFLIGEMELAHRLDIQTMIAPNPFTYGKLEVYQITPERAEELFKRGYDEFSSFYERQEKDNQIIRV